ncbi:MAG: hypothetical protein R2745_01500 [Vicinamibacterales bacterium]
MKLPLMTCALALTATIAAAQPTISASDTVVTPGQAVNVTITGTPGQNFALLGSSVGAGFSYGGVAFSVGAADLALISVGVLNGSGTAVVAVVPPFLGSTLDRYYVQAATSPSAAFVPLTASNGVILRNRDSLPPATPQRYFGGVVTNLNEANILAGGFTLCHSSLYNTSGAGLAATVAGCGSATDVLLVACRPTGSPVLSVAAMALKTDVTFDTGTGATTTRVANGLQWYFHDSHAMGFAEDGGTVNKSTCDTQAGGDRLCLHTVNVGGYRCGSVRGLNSSTAFERRIYTRPGPLQ